MKAKLVCHHFYIKIWKFCHPRTWPVPLPASLPSVSSNIRHTATMNWISIVRYICKSFFLIKFRAEHEREECELFFFFDTFNLVHDFTLPAKKANIKVLVYNC